MLARSYKCNGDDSAGRMSKVMRAWTRSAVMTGDTWSRRLKGPLLLREDLGLQCARPTGQESLAVAAEADVA